MRRIHAEDPLAAMMHVVPLRARSVVRLPYEPMHLLGPARTVCRRTNHHLRTPTRPKRPTPDVASRPLVNLDVIRHPLHDRARVRTT